MYRRKQKNYFIPHKVGTRRLLHRIGEQYSLKIEGKDSRTRVYYDTFDWRLMQRKILMFTEKEDAVLLLEDAKKSYPSPFRGKETGKRIFLHNIVDEKLRTKLSDILAVRALVPLIELDEETTRYRILNSDQKTVAFLSLIIASPVPALHTKNNIKSIRISGLRGYDAEYTHLENMLVENRLQPDDTYRAYKILESMGRKPRGYSSKFDVKLIPKMTAIAAAKLLFGHLLNALDENRLGIVEDIDTEFLHDYRVAVRRIRSLLIQLEGVLDKDIWEEMQKDFRRLGKATNASRDLDVYMLREGEYRNVVPDPLRSGLDSFFSDLLEKRLKEQRKLAKFLDSLSYREMVDKWKTLVFSDEDYPLAGKDSGKKVKTLAGKLILNYYRQCIQTGSSLHKEAADDEIHALRIACKKLRYSLEAFSSLFTEKLTGNLISALKKLQDKLGDFNDLCVQIETIAGYLDDYSEDGSNRKQSIAALGALLGFLYARRIVNKEHIFQDFQKFKIDTIKYNPEKYFASPKDVI
jgi:CHAD domain-containing protein